MLQVSSLPSYLTLSCGHLPTSRRRFLPRPRASNDGYQGPLPGDSPSGSQGGSESLAPWQLMGRVVRVDRLQSVFNQEHVQGGLIRAAAARLSNLEIEDFEVKLADLLVIMPFLQTRLVRMKPDLLAGLTKDVATTAERMIELKYMIPGADVHEICSQRPSLLLDEEWVLIPKALESLAAHFSDVSIAHLVSEEPLLLVENIDKILNELERLTGAPRSGVLNMLLREPSMVHSVVSGLASLGPGAEVMSDL